MGRLLRNWEGNCESPTKNKRKTDAESLKPLRFGNAATEEELNTAAKATDHRSCYQVAVRNFKVCAPGDR